MNVVRTRGLDHTVSFLQAAHRYYDISHRIGNTQNKVEQSRLE
jgi:hypothetical protein